MEPAKFDALSIPDRLPLDVDAPVAIDPLAMRVGLASEEVRKRLKWSARHEVNGRRVCCFYLVEMDTRRLYQGTGAGSTGHYAEAELGLDRRRTAELVRVGRKLLELRELDRAFCEGKLTWAKLLIVARMGSEEHEAAWLRVAFERDVRGLARVAARSRVGGPPRADDDAKGLPEIRFPIHASVSPLVFAKLEQAQKRLSAEFGREVDVATTLATLLDEFLATESDGNAPGRRRIDASIYRVELHESGERGAPLLVETEDGPMPVDGGGAGPGGATSEAVRCDAGVRNHHAPGRHAPGGHAPGGHAPGGHAPGGHVPGAHAEGRDDHDHRARDVKTPPRLRRSVLRRDGHRCRSCRARWSLMVHHIEFRSHGGRTHAENLVSLCARCHGLVHAGLLGIEGASVAAARFVDATGRALSEPEHFEELERLNLTSPEPAASPAAEPGVGQVARPSFETLEDVPEEVDAVWWRSHAHLVRERGETGSLRFVAGAPIEAPPLEFVAPTPVGEAFAGLVGQDDCIERLRDAAASARLRGTCCPHVLLTGPAGTGKTTLARGLATAAQAPLVEVSAPLVTDRASWVRTLAGLPEGSVLFLDEAHVLPKALLEVLLQATSERKLVLPLSDGTTVRYVTLHLPAFTLVAATTNSGAIPSPLRSRFGLRETLVPYGEDDLATIVRGAAAKAGLETTPDAALRIARVSRGTPREANRLLDRTIDHLTLRGTNGLDGDVVERVLARLGYDEDGLDRGDQRYLEVLRESPTPVSLARLARILGDSPSALEEHVEPWLSSRGYVRMTPAGRTLGPRARWRGEEAGAPNVRRGAKVAFGTS